ncbi:hypothetical protein DFS34DRAFT_697229 [Phlyctochytrium arcticum]|nr:hypothetical protein DFS34DRAFT_697229 [Phlyctochytrium arcticum]
MKSCIIKTARFIHADVLNAKLKKAIKDALDKAHYSDASYLIMAGLYGESTDQTLRTDLLHARYRNCTEQDLVTYDMEHGVFHVKKSRKQDIENWDYLIRKQRNKDDVPNDNIAQWSNTHGLALSKVMKTYFGVPISNNDLRRSISMKLSEADHGDVIAQSAIVKKMNHSYPIHQIFYNKRVHCVQCNQRIRGEDLQDIVDGKCSLCQSLVHNDDDKDLFSDVEDPMEDDLDDNEMDTLFELLDKYSEVMDE